MALSQTTCLSSPPALRVILCCVTSSSGRGYLQLRFLSDSHRGPGTWNTPWGFHCHWVEDLSQALNTNSVSPEGCRARIWLHGSFFNSSCLAAAIYTAAKIARDLSPHLESGFYHTYQIPPPGVRTDTR